MRKRDEISEPNSCLNRADDDEPLFVLRAKDVIAPTIVRLWAATADGVHERERRMEAIALAQHMEDWRSRHFHVPGRPVPGGDMVRVVLWVAVDFYGNTAESSEGPSHAVDALVRRHRGARRDVEVHRCEVHLPIPCRAPVAMTSEPVA